MIRKKNKELGETFIVCEKGVVSAEQLAEIEKIVNNEIYHFNYSDDDFREIKISINRDTDKNAKVVVTMFSEMKL